MATLYRCDLCKRLSDESGVGNVGKEWQLKKYKDVFMDIKCYKDYCGDCVRKLVTELVLSSEIDRDY